MEGVLEARSDLEMTTRSADQLEIRWIQTGIVGGLCASALYPTILLAPLPAGALAALAAFLGPAIGIGSLGLYRLIGLHHWSVAAALGAIHNVLAGALFTAMVLVQLAVRRRAEGASIPSEVVGVWLGLDVAWDVYIAIGTVAFGCAMLGHPRFRWPFAVPGVALGLTLVVLNLLPFPMPPAEVGSVDVGPLIGLWYLAVTVQTWRSLGWARRRLRPAEGPV